MSLTGVSKIFAIVFATAILTIGCGRHATPARAPSAVRARAAESHVIPAGATVSIKTVVRIDSSEVPAEAFPAVIVGDLKDASGTTVATSGSPVRLVILRSPPQLGIAALMVAGDWRAVAAGSEGAPLGTLTRGILDTSAGQTGPTESMAIRTTGDTVQVPAGALLVFRLEQPLQIGGTLTR
jgi:hypothetical protein